MSAKFVVKKALNGPNRSFIAWPIWRKVTFAPSEKAVVDVCIKTCCNVFCTLTAP